MECCHRLGEESSVRKVFQFPSGEKLCFESFFVGSKASSGRLEGSAGTSGIKESNPRVVGYRIRFVASFLGRFVREGLLSENVNNRATPFNREGGMELDASPLSVQEGLLGEMTYLGFPHCQARE